MASEIRITGCGAEAGGDLDDHMIVSDDYTVAFDDYTITRDSSSTVTKEREHHNDQLGL